MYCHVSVLESRRNETEAWRGAAERRGRRAQEGAGVEAVRRGKERVGSDQRFIGAPRGGNGGQKLLGKVLIPNS